MEIFIIISICLIPLIALVLILPKVIKKKKANILKQQPNSIENEQNTVIETPKIDDNSIEEKTYSSDDFKSYLDKKGKNITRPNRKENLPNFNFESFDNYKKRQTKNLNKDKSLTEQINDLSPELKALIISGALNKKNYEEY